MQPLSRSPPVSDGRDRDQFTADDHLDALEDLGLTDRPLVVGAHTMG